MVLPGLSFFGSFEGFISCSSRGLDFFCCTFRGIDFLVPLGTRLGTTGIDHGSVGGPIFMIPFGDALLGPIGARLLPSPAHITGIGWTRVAALVCCFFFFASQDSQV